MFIYFMYLVQVLLIKMFYFQNWQFLKRLCSVCIFFFFNKGQLVNVDVNKLDDLERELDEAEKELMGTDLQDQYSRLEMANDKILQLVAQYEDDLAYLRKEVDNIQEIKESLPDGCFKNIGIENPGSQ